MTQEKIWNDVYYKNDMNCYGVIEWNNPRQLISVLENLLNANLAFWIEDNKETPLYTNLATSPISEVACSIINAIFMDENTEYDNGEFEPFNFVTPAPKDGSIVPGESTKYIETCVNKMAEVLLRLPVDDEDHIYYDYFKPKNTKKAFSIKDKDMGDNADIILMYKINIYDAEKE